MATRLTIKSNTVTRAFQTLGQAYEDVEKKFRDVRPVRTVCIRTPIGILGYGKINDRWTLTFIGRGEIEPRPLSDTPVAVRIDAAEFVPALYEAVVDSLGEIPVHVEQAVRFLDCVGTDPAGGPITLSNS